MSEQINYAEVDMSLLRFNESMREPVIDMQRDQCPIKGIQTVHLHAEGYEALAQVLGRAFDQSARGKGKERHSKGEEFTQQVIIEGARRFGTGAMLFQAFKKSEESQRLPKEMAVKELLGAIVYLAAAVIVLEETNE